MGFSFIKTEYDVDRNGHFGKFGGRYVPEVLMQPLKDLEIAYDQAKKDPSFTKEINDLFDHFVGRPTPLYFCNNLTQKYGGAKIFIKNEGLTHTGAHKINHCVGQVLLAKRMGKKKIVAETGAGQHGLATASVAARFGMTCTIYMGEVDFNRQRPNVFLMEQLGAEVIAVKTGTRRLKDAAIAAMQHWTEHCDETYFLLGSVIGPHPYPSIVKDFQSIVGLEVREQISEKYGYTKPDYCIACVGGGSNAMGLFNTFVDDQDVQLIGVEAGGKSVKKNGQHAATISSDAPEGVVEGYRSFFLQDKDGQVLPTSSISAGVDYAGVGPQHAYLHECGRVKYVSVSDREVFEAYQILAKEEGIVCALESAHAVAYAIKFAPTLSSQKVIVVNLSGRGDKDLFITAQKYDAQKWNAYLKKQLEINTLQ